MENDGEFTLLGQGSHNITDSLFTIFTNKLTSLLFMALSQGIILSQQLGDAPRMDTWAQSLVKYL